MQLGNRAPVCVSVGISLEPRPCLLGFTESEDSSVGSLILELFWGRFCGVSSPLVESLWDFLRGR